jgi:DNA repair exonuclease SbcCD ATPase subunit
MADYLLSLHLKNFGPWEDQFFEFNRGVNVFVGESDTGKSAILKGLKFVLFDELPKSADGPLGFITRPLVRGKLCEVTLRLYADGKIRTVTRRKGKSINEYQLDSGIPQRANNKKIPEQIAKLLNIKPVNFHSQSDPPFLLSEKPGDVAKQLAEIIDIQEIDEIVSHAFSFIRENNKELKDKESNLDNMHEELQKLNFVNAFKSKVDVLISLEDKFNNLYKKFNNIELIVHSIGVLEMEKVRHIKLIGLKNKICEIERLHGKCEKLITKLNYVKDHFESIERLNRQNDQYKLLVRLQGQIAQYNAKISQYDTLFDEYTKVHNITKRLKELSDENISVSDNLKLNKEKLKNMVCPTCGQKLNVTEE